jgi:HK97 gp10 family phage protein
MAGSAGGISINISGMTAVIADFARFGDEIQKKTTRSAGRKAAAVLKKAAIRNAPHSGIDRSRFGSVAVLTDGVIGIKYEYKRKHLRQQINIQEVKTKHGDPKYLIRVGDAYWANFIELGTKVREGRGSIDKEKTKFLGKTADSMTDEVVAIFEREIEAALSKFR